MPFGSRRKKAHEWSEVISDEESGQVLCKYCQATISKKIERVRLHLKKCRNRETLITPLRIEIFESSPAGSSVSSMPSELHHSHLTPKRRQTKLDNFNIITTEEQKEILDVLVAKFFYANNIPFSLVNSAEYKAMIEGLRPGYVGPDQLNLSNNLIEKVADDIDNNIKSKVQEHNTVTLSQDGWSDIKNYPFKTISIHTGRHAFLLNAVDGESNKKTPEESLESAIKICMEKYGKTVFAVCTDNEFKMQTKGHLFNENNLDLLIYGCSAHYINLLGDEISPKNILKDIIEVHKYFHNHHQSHGWLREKKGIMPELPNCTRWNSQYECLSTFVENYSKYIEIMTEHIEEIPRDITKLLDNVTIYKEAVQHLKQQSVICRGLDLIQAENTNIAQAVEIWMDLYENPDLESNKDLIKRTMEQALEPFHYLANFCDPRFRGKRLTTNQEDYAENWLLENHPDWLAIFMSFRIADAELCPSFLFSESFINTTTPNQWWKIMELKTSKKGSLHTGFIKFIQSLLSCPASTGSSEPIFSTFGLDWAKLRKQLPADKAEKLFKIYDFLRKKY